MRIGPALLFGVVLVACASAQAAGFAHNGNFVVLAPDQAMAERLLDRAEFYRRQVAVDWLGEELPPSVGPVVINFALSSKEDSGLTWPADYPGRKYHKMWLTTSFERACGSTLGHEMTHAVLATQFKDQLPAWAAEGAAGLADEDDRTAIRRRILAWFAKTGNWPNLAELLDAPAVLADDQRAYATATSLTEFLLTHGDRQTLLRFAVAGKKSGWAEALQQHYRITGVGALQEAWQNWAAAQSSSAAHAGTATKPRFFAADRGELTPVR